MKNDRKWKRRDVGRREKQQKWQVYGNILINIMIEYNIIGVLNSIEI